MPRVTERPELVAALSRSGRTLRVAARLCVDDAGKVQSVELRLPTGYRPFDEIVVERVKRWRFCPVRPPRGLYCREVGFAWRAGKATFTSRGERVGGEGPRPPENPYGDGRLPIP